MAVTDFASSVTLIGWLPWQACQRLKRSTTWRREGSIRLDPVDALHRITTSERNKRVPAPSGPNLIATERPPRNKVRGILPAIAPDGKLAARNSRSTPASFCASGVSAGIRPLGGSTINDVRAPVRLKDTK